MSTLSDALAALAGDGIIFTSFIVDDDGNMITASVPGVSVSKDGTQQVKAIECSVEVIAAVSLAVQNELGGIYV
jgi:hypothetical protein